MRVQRKAWWWRRRRGSRSFGFEHESQKIPHVGCHCWAPLLGPIAWVPLFGAIAGCHCWCAIAGCHCGVPWLDAIAGAIAACHCERPLREKIDQSVTPFSAALFSALITHKNCLVLSGVYAGIIHFEKYAKTVSDMQSACSLVFIGHLR